MSSFFTLPASQRKRKRTDDRSGKAPKRRGIERTTASSEKGERRPQRPRDQERDESISGSGSEVEVEPETPEESEASSEEDENATERRVRLAQRYLSNLKEEVEETGFDAQDLDDDLVAKRLKEDVDEAKGRQFRLVAESLDFARATHCSFRADTLATTAVAVRQPYAYTVSKDKTLVKWKLQPPKSPTQTNGTNGRKPGPRKKRPQQMAFVKGVKIRASASQQHGHNGPILAVAASPDGRFVATGGADKKLIIWSAEDLTPLKTFTTHRDKVLGLAFAPSTSSQPGLGAQLFSASADRSIKTYSLASEESLAYVETLFGHQDHVLDVSAMSVDQCVSVGARDRSARLWKVVDETQLKFLGDSSAKDTYQSGSLDCVAALPPQHFVTGSDSGAISLWSIHRKKASFTVQTAHGVDEPLPLEDVTSEADPKNVADLKRLDKRRPIPRAITALVALPGTDVVLSGSWDGWVRVWKVSDDKRSLISLGKLGDGFKAHDEGAQEPDNIIMKGDSTIQEHTGTPEAHEVAGVPTGQIRGFINSLAVFERRKELVDAFGGKKEGETQGICIVVGTGKESRLGNWMKAPRGRNGVIVFEVSTL
jgi:ribosomal RNA-processing protein 9